MSYNTKVYRKQGGDELVLAAGGVLTGETGSEANFASVTYSDLYYEDKQTSLAGINPIGPAAAPAADPAGEGWLFAGGSSDNVAVLVVQSPHDTKQGLIEIHPHIHWRKTTAASGNVVWRLEYKYAGIGGDFGDYVQLGTDQKLPIAASVDNNTATRHLITSFGTLPLVSDLSTIIVFKITRVASDTVNDTYAADCLAISFDYHYPKDSPGSATEFIK